MKTLNEYINESFIISKIKDKIKKVTNEFLQSIMNDYKLPYISFHNGKCFAPHNSINYTDDNIIKFISDLEKYLTDNYKDQITKFKTERYDKGNVADIDIYEFANCSIEEISTIYADISNKFIELSKKLDNSYGKKQLYHDNWKKDAYIDEYAVELEIYDTNDKTFKFYVYPSVELITDQSIITK